MNCTFNPRAATAQELLKFYNDNNAQTVKRFSDRTAAERRCQETVDRLNAAQNLASVITSAWAAPQSAELVPAPVRAVNAVGPRPEMVASLKIDRRITCVATGVEYANACQVWKAGLVSASQGDRLSALLYGAAKRDEYPAVTVNGHAFKLTVGGGV